MIWVLYGIGGLVALVIVMAVIGMLLPQGHVAARRARIGQPPERLWQDVTDVAAYPAWRADLKQVELLPTQDGRVAWKEIGKQGAIPMAVVDATPPRRLVVKITDPKLPFGGTWTYELTPDGDGSVVSITEHGEVYNPVFRFLARFIFGYTATLDAYLRALAGKYGETVQPVAGA